MFTRNVLALSLVSFLTDASSEIIAPLLPLFLTGTLGASAALVGLIEGAADSIAALAKVGSGWWSDRVRRRKPLIVVGYGIASLVRPLVAIAVSPWQVLAIRVTDRIGKGVRGAPRDALLADSVEPERRGRAFGFHRGADHAGAVVGPIIALVGLNLLGLSLRDLFLVAAIPGALALLAALFLVREEAPRRPAWETAPKTAPETAWETAPVPAAPVGAGGGAGLGRPFRNVLLAVVVFTLGNSTDAFLLLRATQLGIPVTAAPLLWLALHVVKMLSSTPGGALSDRLGRRPLIVAGWGLYAAVYAGFALARHAWQGWALFAVYGVVFGLTEGSEKAYVADLVPPGRRGAAFGWYHAAVGIAALPASLLFGLVWDRFGSPAAFAAGSGIALLATLVLFLGAPEAAAPVRSTGS